ncbi:MAG: response regulator [Prochloraceae cyanobacterium]
MKILLVEDDLLVAKSTARLIERMGGHQVKVSDSPTEVIESCQSGKIDLVLMDINLPGAKWQDEDVSGAELAKLLKTEDKTAHIPIIILTAYALTSEKEDLLNISGADELLTKPIRDYSTLMRLIEKLTK